MTTNGKVCVVAFLLAIFPLVAQGSTCSEPPSGLVSWWPGDANENDIVDLNNPIGMNEVSLVPGEVLTGFVFGSTGYIEFAPASSLANQKFTWAAWVNPQGAYSDQYGSVIVVQNDSSLSDVIALDWRDSPDSRFLFVFGNQTNEIIYSTDMFPAGSFYHVAGTYDGKTFRLYVNGVLEGSFKETKTIGYTTYPWGVGESFILGIGNGFREWIGVIDELQAFNRPLSTSELLSIYKAGTHGECKGLLLNPTRLSFAKQPVGTTSVPRSVTATNITSSPISLTSIGFTGLDSGDFGETNTCGGMVPVGGKCTINVTFSPSAIGARRASMSLKDTAPGSPQRVFVSGTGE
jgi:hypothetical protein